MGLRSVLARYVSSHGNDQVPVVDILILLSYNLVIGKEPLYELPAWVASIDRRPISFADYEPVQHTYGISPITLPWAV